MAGYPSALKTVVHMAAPPGVKCIDGYDRLEYASSLGGTYGGMLGN
jgi:hypothetical protein